MARVVASTRSLIGKSNCPMKKKLTRAINKRPNKSVANIPAIQTAASNKNNFTLVVIIIFPLPEGGKLVKDCNH